MISLAIAVLMHIQYYPGPPFWSRDPRDYPPPPPRYQTDKDLCIYQGICRDPRRLPSRPLFTLPPGPPPPPGPYYDDDMDDDRDR